MVAGRPAARPEADPVGVPLGAAVGVGLVVLEQPDRAATIVIISAIASIIDIFLGCMTYTLLVNPVKR